MISAATNLDASARGSTVPLFWMRFQVSVALDSSTTLNSMVALNRSTAYAELPTGFAQEHAIIPGLGGSAAIEALTDAGTANLLVNCGVGPGGRFV